MQFYAGIGPRITPADVCRRETGIAQKLYEMGFLLRSGHAKGSDQAFEAGVPDPGCAEIFLPWPKFEGSNSTLYLISPAAEELARQFHPRYDRLSQGAKKLIARDGYQVLGRCLDDPVAFVACWTEGGKVVGGTGQALRIAAYYQIPIFNLHSARDGDIINYATKVLIQAER